MGDPLAGERAQRLGDGRRESPRAGGRVARRSRPGRGPCRPAAGRARRRSARPRPGRGRPRGTPRRRGRAARATPSGGCRCRRTRRSTRRRAAASMPQHPRAVRPDHERRAAGPRAARQELAVAGLVVRAVEVDRPVAEQRPDDRERLLEPVDPMVEREAERAELGLVPAGPEAEDEPAAADLVDRGRLLGQHRRVVEARARHERPELDPRRRGGEAGERRPRLPRAARLAGPASDTAGGRRPRSSRSRASSIARAISSELGPAHLALDLGELDADLQGTHGAEPSSRPRLDRATRRRSDPARPAPGGPRRAGCATPSHTSS